MIRSILMVDEDPLLASEIVEAARHKGRTATAASTFRDAVRLLETRRPDVLVTGLRLGAYNGLHLMLRGRAEHPALCAIVVGPNDPALAREALALGAAAYLPRPIGAPAILEEIDRLPAAADEDYGGGPLPSAGSVEASVG